MYLWRAVDSESEILEVPVHPRRDKASALTLGALAPMTDAFVPIHSLAFWRLSFALALS
jgi:DDE domain